MTSAPTTAATAAPNDVGGRAGRLVRARRLCARRAGDPAAGRAVPRPVGRGHPQAHVPDHRPARARALPAARPHHSGVARLSGLAGGRQGRRASAISARCSATAATRRANSCRPASSRSAAPTRRRPTPRCWRSGSRPPAHYGLAAPDIRIGDVGAVRRADRRARSGAGLEAAAGQGLQPQEPSLAHDLDRLTLGAANARPGISGRAGGARRLRPEGARTRWSPICCRSPASRAVGGRSVGEIADRFLEQAALGAQSSLPRETRALIERFLAIARRSGRGRRRAARARARRQARARRRARPVREPHRLSRRARRRRHAASASRPRFGRGLDYYTGFVFELHDPGARAAGQLVAGGRYDGLLTRLGAREPIPAVGFAVWIERLAAVRSAT